MLAEALLVVARAAHQQAQPDDAIEDQHHGGKHRVARQCPGLEAAGQHQRDDQRNLDHGDRQRQDQRAEGFAHAVRDHLGMMHGGQHAANQARGQQDRVPAASPQQGARQDQPASDGGGQGPGREEAGSFHGVRSWRGVLRMRGKRWCGRSSPSIWESLHCNNSAGIGQSPSRPLRRLATCRRAESGGTRSPKAGDRWCRELSRFLVT